MKFSATKEKLLEGLQQVQNVVSTRTTLPILSNVLLQATDGAVHLTPIDVDGKNAASIRSGQSFFKILGLPEEEFPPLPKFEDAKVVTIRQKDLRDGLRKSSYAISTDETRYVLNGLLF